MLRKLLDWSFERDAPKLETEAFKARKIWCSMSAEERRNARGWRGPVLMISCN